MARKHSFTLRESELSEHGFSLRNHVRKDKSSGRVICSDRAKACHDRRLHINKCLKGLYGMPTEKVCKYSMSKQPYKSEFYHLLYLLSLVTNITFKLSSASLSRRSFSMT